MKDINFSLFTGLSLLLISANLIAQETTTQTSKKNDKWLKKQDIRLKNEVNASKDQNSREEPLDFIKLTDPFRHQYDFNEMVREKMACDKSRSSEKSHLESYRLYRWE